MSIFDRLSSDPGISPRPSQNIAPASIFDRVEQQEQSVPPPVPAQTFEPGAGNTVSRVLYEQGRGAFQALDSATDQVANLLLYGGSKVADAFGVQDPRFSGATLRGAMLESGGNPFQSTVASVAGIPTDASGALLPTAESTAGTYNPEAIANVLGRQVPQVALSANPLGAASFAVASSGGSDNLNEFYQAAKARGLDDDKATEAAMAAQSMSLAGQAVIEKFSPLNRLMKKVGVKDQGALTRIARTAFEEANTEVAQQFVEEAIKVGLLPPEARTSDVYKDAAKSLMDAYVLGGLSGGVFQGGAEVPGAVSNARASAATRTGGSIFDRVGDGAVTAEDIQRAEAIIAPIAPESIARLRPIDRQTREPIPLEDDYAKAKYIVENPGFRGPNKQVAKDYVDAVDRYRNATGATNETVTPTPEVQTEPDVDVAQPVQPGPESVRTPSETGGEGAQPETPGVSGPADTVGGTEQTVNFLSDSDTPPVRSVERKNNAVAEATALAGKENSPVAGYKFGLAPKNTGQAKLQKAMEGRGLDVVWYDGSARGFVSKSTPGVLFINRDPRFAASSLRESVLHEFGHHLQQNSPEVFAKLKAAMTPAQVASGQSIASERRNIVQEASGRPASERDAAYDAAEAEVIPFEAIANDPDIRRRLGEAGILTRVISSMRKFVNKLRGRKGTGNALIDETIRVLDEKIIAPLEAEADTMNFRAETDLPGTSYGYWWFPGEGYVPVAEQDHENVANGKGYDGYSGAFDAGAVRVVAKPKSNEVSFEAFLPEHFKNVSGMVRQAIDEGKTVRLDIQTEGASAVLQSTADDRISKSRAMLKFNRITRGEFEPGDLAVPSFMPSVASSITKDVDETPRNLIRQSRERSRGESAAANTEARDITYQFDKAIRSDFGKPYSDLTAREHAALYAALHGDAIAYNTLPADTQLAVDRMRNLIDAGTDELIAQLRTANTASARRLVRVMGTNRGQYANLSYRLFEQPQKQIRAVMEGKGRFKKIRDDYYNFIEQQLVTAGVTPSKDKVEAVMQQVLEDMVGQGVMGRAVTGQGMVVPMSGRKPLGILKKRQSLPPALRAAMGQNVNAPIVFQMTVAKQAAMIAAHKFQTRLLKDGKGKWLFKEPPSKEFIHQIYPDNKFNPLSGWYTTREIKAQVLQYENQLPETVNALSRLWRKANAVSRQAATVGSTAALGANIIGQPGFLISTGVFSPVQLAKVYSPGKPQMQALLEEFPVTRRIMDETFGLGGDVSPQLRDEIAELTKLGLLNDSVFARDAIEAARELGLDPNTLATKGTIGKILNAAQSPVRFARGFYNLSDTRARLLIYEDGLRQLKKAYPNRDVAELKVEAADRAKNTYPSYERAWDWSKTVSRSGVIGPFAPFMAEIYRTTRNNLAYGAKDMRDGWGRWQRGDDGGKEQFMWGLRRYVGTTSLLSATPVIAGSLSYLLAGLDGEEEDRLRESLPPWLRNTTGFFVKEPDGTYQYYNLSRYLPVLSFTDTAQSLVEDDIWEGMSTAASPFLSEQLVTSRVLDVARNQTQNGQPVFNTEDTEEQKVKDSMEHILAPVVPDIIRRPVNKLIPAASGRTDRWGKPLDFEDELLRFFGFTVTTVDTKTNLGFQAQAHVARNRNAVTIFTNALKNLGTPDESDILQAYSRMEDARFRIWQDTYQRVQSAREAGVSDRDIRESLREGTSKGSETRGLAAADIGYIMRGEYQPYNFINNERYMAARRNHDDKIDSDRLTRLNRAYRRKSLDVKEPS